MLIIRSIVDTWWRHQMETFSALLAICAGNSPVIGEFTAQRPVTQNFDVFFDPWLNKRLSKQLRGWWFETPSRSLWRHSKMLPTNCLRLFQLLMSEMFVYAVTCLLFAMAQVSCGYHDVLKILFAAHIMSPTSHVSFITNIWLTRTWIWKQYWVLSLLSFCVWHFSPLF